MTSEEFLLANLKELADATGIEASRWSRYFRGSVSPRESTLHRAAKKLNMETSDLLALLQKRRSWVTRTSR